MIRFAENLNKMIAAGLGGAMEAPSTEVAVGHRVRYMEASGAVATFETNVAAPIRSLRVDMRPIQAGSGDPSPENIRPISGRESVTVTRTGVNAASGAITTYNHDISINYPSTDHDYHPGTVSSVTIQLGQTVYGGKLDVVSGKLVVDKAFLTIDGTADWTMHSSGKYYVSDITTGATQSTEYISNQYLFAGKGASVSTEIDTDKRFYGQIRYRRIWVYDSQYTSLNDFKAALSTTPLQIVYPLARPVTVQLSPQQITTLKGTNNVWSNSGNVTLEYLYYEETEGY